jgi:hypothetical protein
MRAAFTTERDRLLAGLRSDTPPEQWQVGQ